MKGISFITFLIFINGFYIGYENDKRKDPPKFLPYSQNIPGSDVSIELIPVHGGTFMMGSPEREAGRDKDGGSRSEVKVDSFWIGAYEITWEQYDLFVVEEISNLKNIKLSINGEVEIEVDGISSPTPPYIDMSFGMGRDGYPAVNMTHYAAVMFSKWLSAKTGHFYRLPTEAEWEYACRAGTTTAYSFGDDPEMLDDFAWYNGNTQGGYEKVGTKKPNTWGMHDMHGNVAEWTMDQYIKEYHEQMGDETADNPWFKPTELYPRSVRGGSWMDVRGDLRCAKRRGSSKKWKQRDPQMPKSLWWLTDAPFVGFRLIRPKETPSKEEMDEFWIDAMQDFDL
jgi:formylglycine-generating enzyme required for sulfatase activity